MQLNLLTDWIRAAEVPALKRPVDDRHAPRLVNIRFGKRSSTEQRYAQDRKIVLAHPLKEAIPFLRVRFACAFCFAAESAVRRQSAGFRSVGHSRNRLEARQERAKEG